tara:strand:+ start:152 stop:871 length:720 start_codon:yes stop_codon:yes gene_type:complete
MSLAKKVLRALRKTIDEESNPIDSLKKKSNITNILTSVIKRLCESDMKIFCKLLEFGEVFEILKDELDNQEERAAKPETEVETEPRPELGADETESENAPQEFIKNLNNYFKNNCNEISFENKYKSKIYKCTTKKRIQAIINNQSCPNGKYYQFTVNISPNYTGKFEIFSSNISNANVSNPNKALNSFVLVFKGNNKIKLTNSENKDVYYLSLKKKPNQKDKSLVFYLINQNKGSEICN